MAWQLKLEKFKQLLARDLFTLLPTVWHAHSTPAIDTWKHLARWFDWTIAKMPIRYQYNFDSFECGMRYRRAQWGSTHIFIGKAYFIVKIGLQTHKHTLSSEHTATLYRSTKWPPFNIFAIASWCCVGNHIRTLSHQNAKSKRMCILPFSTEL